MKSFLFVLVLFISGSSFGQENTDERNTNSRFQNKNSALNCNNWLFLPSSPSFVGVGKLNVLGNQITVEATINRTTPYTGGSLYAGDVVSKHFDPTDVNYLLRPNHAEITTTNGYFRTPNICEIKLNTVYHIAMVYNGVFLKFYRNGFLMSQIPASGNLIQNNWPTQIGYYVDQVLNTNFIGYINDVRIWNVARTQAEIRTYMNSSLPNPITQAGLLAYYTFDDLKNKQGNPAWNGTLGGSATINQNNPNCTFVADSCNALSCNVQSDFTFQQDVCNPLSVQFSGATGSSSANSYWSFGDGTTASGNIKVTYTYSSPGIYTVKHFVRNSCADTVRKNISVAIIKENIIITADTTICFGATKQLRSLPSLEFCWSPKTYLDNPDSPNPITSSPQTITYYLNAKITGNNLVVNGDFSIGNTGFTSAYIYANPNITEGQYFVGINPQAWNSALSSCTDHTTASGNMLLVNGSPTPDVNVWRQTITVTPNTNYAFSTWIQALWPPNPAQLQFSINGKPIASLITASLPTCTWTQFYTTWNSGTSSSAIISIINKNTQVQGNDFALDDISFAPVFIKRDSIIITVDKPVVKTNNDTTVCSGSQIQLNTNGASSYSWTPLTGLSNANISNPIATINNATTYIVSGITVNGCNAKDTVIIIPQPKPLITKSNDTTLCKSTPIQIFVTGGVSYTWSPTRGLSNANISNPVASPFATTLYVVTVTDAKACAYMDSVKLTIKLPPVFSVSPYQNVCVKDSKQLSASGGNSYLWSPSTFLNDPNISNPVSTPDITTIYSVKIMDNSCNDSTTLTTTLNVLPLPIITTSKTNDLDCSINSSQLNATGGNLYMWHPSTLLNNPTNPNPIATPISTTLFIVTGTDNNGCKNSDSITVNVSNTKGGGYNMPNAFTPNNDGINDCFGLKYWGIVTKLNYSIYNRFGQKLFNSNDIAKCWDGKFKGVLQNIGVYVYVINATTTCGEVNKKGTFVLMR